jgi:hypothetical protein
VDAQRGILNPNGWMWSCSAPHIGRHPPWVVAPDWRRSYVWLRRPRSRAQTYSGSGRLLGADPSITVVMPAADHISTEVPALDAGTDLRGRGCRVTAGALRADLRGLGWDRVLSVHTKES